MRRAILAAALVLALPGSASAAVEPGVYEGTVTTGEGGTVTLTVTDGGQTVNASFSGLGNANNSCFGVGFETGPIPLSDNGSFNYLSGNGQVSASGSIGRSSAGGTAQVLTSPCTTGSQAWRIVGPDATFDLGGPIVGQDIFHPKAKGQTIPAKVKRGEKVSVLMGFYNAGVDPATLNIGGCGKGKVLKPKYVAEGGGDVTDLVVDNDHSSPELDPASAERYGVEMQLKVLNSAEVGEVAKCRVTADDGLLIDAIAARITVKKG